MEMLSANTIPYLVAHSISLQRVRLKLLTKQDFGETAAYDHQESI